MLRPTNECGITAARAPGRTGGADHRGLAGPAGRRTVLPVSVRTLPSGASVLRPPCTWCGRRPVCRPGNTERVRLAALSLVCRLRSQRSFPHAVPPRVPEPCMSSRVHSNPPRLQGEPGRPQEPSSPPRACMRPCVCPQGRATRPRPRSHSTPTRGVRGSPQRCRQGLCQLTSDTLQCLWPQEAPPPDQGSGQLGTQEAGGQEESNATPRSEAAFPLRDPRKRMLCRRDARTRCQLTRSGPDTIDRQAGTLGSHSGAL